MMDDKGVKLQYTATQRRIQSKSKCNQRILLKERKKNGITKKETKLSKFNQIIYNLRFYVRT